MQENQPYGTFDSSFFLKKNLRFLRKKVKLSQEELGTKIGMNRGNIASYENGSAEPKICNLLKLAKLFRITVVDLLEKDLGDNKVLEETGENYGAQNGEEAKLIAQYFKYADEFQTFFDSLHTCHRFKLDSLEELPKEYKVLDSNFEQLHEAATNLLHNHQALLDFMKCRVK